MSAWEKLRDVRLPGERCVCCWACGASSCPRGWYAPWLVERAHIVNKPRREDRRVCVLLCSVCHRVQHGERLAGFARPRLELPHMLALKITCDPGFWDPAFMQSCSVQRLPEPEVLPEFFWYWRRKYGGVFDRLAVDGFVLDGANGRQQVDEGKGNPGGA